MNRKELLKTLIYQKISKTRPLTENYFLIEDRLPELTKKYIGTRKVQSNYVSAAGIVAGKRPEYKETPILDTSHETHADLKAHTPEMVLSKIVGADPTENKQYADRMLHWYSKSSELPPKAGMGETHFGVLSPEQEEKANQIHSQQIRQETETKANYHSQWHPFKLEDLGRAKDALEVYHRAKNASDFPKEFKDINKVNSLKHLENIVEPFRFRKTAGEAERELRSKGTTLLHDDPDLAVYHVKTQEASCSLGAGTRWCVSGDEYNMFDHYNATSPLIMFHDKKGTMAPHLDEPRNKGNYKRYMFHFGENRNARSLDELTGGQGEGTDYQFMDESDSPVDYEKFIQKFPQAKNIPALQHMHSILFQADTPEQKAVKYATDPQEVKKTVEHFKKYSEMQRPNIHTIEDHFVGALGTEKEGETHAHPNHPVLTHYFGNDSHAPGASSEESSNFLTSVLKHPNAASIIRRQHADSIVRRNLYKPEHAGKLITAVDDSRLQHHLYDVVKTNFDPEKHSISHYYFLSKIKNPQLIQRAYQDFKNKPVAPHLSVLIPSSVHELIASNEHTPDHILHELATNVNISRIKQKNSSGETYRDNTGSVALRTLLNKMEKRGGI